MQRALASLEGPALQMEVAPRLAMHPSPLLLALSSMLQLSTEELEEAIARETAENPALESTEVAACSICDGGRDRTCPRCEPVPLPTGAWNGAPMTGVMDVASRSTPREALLEEARLLLPTEDISVGEFVVGSLDDRGLLPGGATAVAAQLSVELSRVDRVLRALREVGSPGIGAGDVRESLLLQLDRLQTDRAVSDGQEQLVFARARAIVEEHLPAMAQGRFASVARALGVTVEEVEAARSFIRERLSPYPSSSLADGQPVAPVLPDVVVRQVPGCPGQLHVEVVDERRFRLRVDPLYRLLADMSATTDAKGLSAETRRHVRQAVRRAALFIECLADRNRTLRRIAEHVIEVQRGFVLDGPQHLRPLTRARVAQVIGVHESTVSRATSGKYVMLPSGRIVAFRDFFDASLGVRDALRRIIEEERRPLSDREVADRLRDLGYRVARRTVAKYRMKLGLLPRAVRGVLPTRPPPA